ASDRSGGSWPGPSRRGLEELRQPRQIVGGGREGEGPTDALATAELGPLLACDRLDPAKSFLDPLANALANRIARVSRRPAVDRRGAAACVLRDVGRCVHRAQLVDEVLGVVALVGGERD